jgi:hypothetical protein
MAMRLTSKLSQVTFSGPALTGIRNQSTALKGLRADWAAYNAVTRTAQGRAKATATQMTAHREAASKLSATLKSSASVLGRTTFGVAGLAVATSGLGEQIGLTNTVSLGLMGTMAGPYGAAIGSAVGLTMDMAQAQGAVADQLARVHTAVAAGDLETAVASLKALKDTQRDINSVDGLGDFFGDIGQSGGASLLQGLGTISVDGLKEAEAEVARLKKEFADNAPMRAMASAIAANQIAARGTASQFIGLGKSLSDSKTGLRGWIHELEAQARALTQFGNNAAIAAQKGLRDGLVKELQAAGPAGALRMKQLADGTAGEIRRANTAWMAGRRAIQAYSDAVAGVPPGKTTKITEVGAAQARARIGLMKNEIRTTKDRIVHMDEKGAAAARARIAQLRAAINALHDRTINITTVYSKRNSQSGRGPAGVTAQVDEGARGMLWHGGVRHYARGDVANRHQPEIAPGSRNWRVWGEEETQGESYIPHANDDRRPRARTLTEQTVAILGGDPNSIEWYARGGHRGGKGGGGGGKHVNHHLMALKDALERNTKAVDMQTAVRDTVVQKRGELASTVRDSFTSDLFGETNAWAPGGGGGSALGILKADIAKANAYKGAVYNLKKAGLDGDALASITDLNKAQAVLSLGKSGIGQFESLFNQRASAASQAGAYAGTAAYAAQQVAANKILTAQLAEARKLTAEIRHMRHQNKGHAKEVGDHVAKGVNKAATAGKRGRRT